MRPDYSRLVDFLRETADMRYIEAVLGWDQQTYMPEGGNPSRSRQMAQVSALAHERLIGAEMGELLESCAASDDLEDEQRAMLREVRRDRDRAVKLPTALVKELTETSGRAHTIWADARGRNDFAAFIPILGRLVELKRQEAACLGWADGGGPYDALLDAFEPGATVASLDPVIRRARELVVPAVRAIADSPVKPEHNLLTAGYDAAGQERFCHDLLADLGWDPSRARLDVSVHPFTTSFGVNDVRITTRYQPSWLPAAVFGVIHEAGHAFYELGLPAAHEGTPLAEAVSLGVHESQSRFWENQIGRSLPFWRRYFPRLKNIFPGVLADVDLERFHLAINQVQPSFIRVEADEATYNLHIIVRYELEKNLINGALPVADLPAAWNQSMQDFLGITPPDDAQGVLQDIHWSLGAFGYFPTYLLGNLYAAQWMAALRREMSDLDQRVEQGDFAPIRAWMTERIHRHGRRYLPSELAVRISGETLNPEHFGAYLKERFSDLYKVNW